MLRRHIEKELLAYLKIMPVVLIIGARQTGKTTLVESLMKRNHWHYVTLDDEISLSSAKQNPADWLDALPKPVIIDEVQRIPEIFLPIKRDVDQHRKAGRYLLTGSANPLLLPKLGDSLAGRMGIVTLFPFSQGELLKKEEKFIQRAFWDNLEDIQYNELSRNDLYQLLLRGGFPPVYKFEDSNDISRWFRSYLQAMIQRDVRDLANLEGLREFPRLMQLLAIRSASLLNASEISRTLGMVNMTLSRYLHLLETLFFVFLLPAWYTNLGKRLVKSPKIHICDTAIMAQLLEVNETRLHHDSSLFGRFLESFVFSELLKQKSWSEISTEIYHFRDGNSEVDFILEKPDGSLVGIEVKSASKIRSNDLKGLEHLKKFSGSNFKRGIILYLGKNNEFLKSDMIAMPIQSLWS